MISFWRHGGMPARRTASHRALRHPPAPAQAPATFTHGLAACLAIAALVAGPAAAQPVSRAETLLFETDHLARTKAPVALVYSFRKVSNVEPEFRDTVELALSRKDGHLHARLRFLSGARKHEVADLDDAHGNPVLLGFLERDIAEMKRLTGGSTTYFRKRIRLALANAAQVSAQRISFKGKTLDAQSVRIQPYLDDPLHARFEPYVHKTYTFILSDAIPGGVYQLRTSLENGLAARAITASAGSGKAQLAARPGMAEHAATPPGAAKAGAAQPGAGTPGAAARVAQQADAPVIDETLTLDRVTDSQQ